MVRVLEPKDVIALLRSEIDRAGNQVAWCKKTGINRTVLNKVLNGRCLLTPSIIAALKLRVVFISAGKSLKRK